jgi:hypothetical protein
VAGSDLTIGDIAPILRVGKRTLETWLAQIYCEPPTTTDFNSTCAADAKGYGRPRACAN